MPAWEAWDAAHPQHRLVAELDGEVAGWAALSPVSERSLLPRRRREQRLRRRVGPRAGIGRALLEELIVRSEAAGIWTLEAGIFPENRASIRLHVVCGFRLVGVRERLGELDGVWRDVAAAGAEERRRLGRLAAVRVPVRRLPVGAERAGARPGALPRRPRPGRRRSSTSTRISRTYPLRSRGGIRCRRRSGSRRPPRGPGSAPASSSSPTARSAAPSGCGGCSGISGTTTAPCCSAGSTPGAGRFARARRRSSRRRSCRASATETRSSAEELVRRLADPSLVLVDARPANRWRGEPNPIDDPPGRIPGALSAPWAEPQPPLPEGELVAYCGSGITACVVLHRASLAGREGRLYPGSWSDWSKRGLPVERHALADGVRDGDGRVHLLRARLDGIVGPSARPCGAPHDRRRERFPRRPSARRRAGAPAASAIVFAFASGVRDRAASGRSRRARPGRRRARLGPETPVAPALTAASTSATRPVDRER